MNSDKLENIVGYNMDSDFDITEYFLEDEIESEEEREEREWIEDQISLFIENYRI